MGEKGSHKNKLKDFFRILKKKKEKEKKKQEAKKKNLNEKNILKKILMIIGYFGTIITYPLTKKSKSKNEKKDSISVSLKKNTPIVEKQSTGTKKIHLEKETVIQNEIEKKDSIKKIFHHSNLNFNQPIKKEKFILQRNKQIDIKQPINEKEITKKYISIQSDKIEETKKKAISNINQKQIYDKKQNHQTYPSTSLKETIMPKVLIAGGLASHALDSVSKEIMETIQDVMSPNKENKNTLMGQLAIEKNEIEKTNVQEKQIFENKNKKIQNAKYEKKQILEDNTEIHIIKKDLNDLFSNEPINEKKELAKEKKIDNQDQSITPIFLSITEIESSISVVKNDIEKEENEWLYIDHSLKLLDEKKKKKLIPSIIQRKSSDILSLPIPFLKNSWIAKITHSIIVNHRIKRMKKLIYKEYKIEYYNLKKILENIDNHKDIILKNISINKNSLEEIEKLKAELLKINDNSLEVIKANQYLSQIELDLIKQNKKLKEQLEQNKKLEEKGKEKIKVLEKKAH